MELNVLYTINQKYLDIMLVSLISLVFNNKTYDKIKFHIICSDLELSDYQKILTSVKDLSNVEIEFYPLDNFNISKLGIPDWRGNQTANARLFYQSILKLNNIDKLLYLDADTIVVGDLGEINNFDKTIMAVKDLCLNSYARYLNLPHYYNSGVLVFNVDAWEKDMCEERIIKYLKENKTENLNFPDQDILNITLSDTIEPLDVKYNIGPYALLDDQRLVKLYYNEKLRQFTYSEITEALKDPKIYHSYGLLGLKPWTNNNINPFNEDFMKYMNFIDSSYNKEELSGLRKFLNDNKSLFYAFLVARSFISPQLESGLRKKLHNRK